MNIIYFMLFKIFRYLGNLGLRPIIQKKCVTNATYFNHYIIQKKQCQAVSINYISCDIKLYIHIHTHIYYRVTCSNKQCKELTIACHAIQHFISSDIHYDNAYQRTYNTIYHTNTYYTI